MNDLCYIFDTLFTMSLFLNQIVVFNSVIKLNKISYDLLTRLKAIYMIYLRANGNPNSLSSKHFKRGFN